MHSPRVIEPAPASRRPRTLVVGALIGLVALVVVAAAFLIPRSGAAAPSAKTPVLSTVRVTAGDMVAETKVAGTIAYAQSTEVDAGRPGVITELPGAGASVGPGGVLYRIDTRPVILLSGSAPAWRDFDSGMDDGNDVLQLEQNLSALGFFGEEPDARFDWDTTVAIRDWQSSLGLERTGTVERSDVMFWSGALRVDSVLARLGQDVGPGSTILQATGPEQVVDVAVKSSDRGLAVAGQAVSITLPDGSTTEGVIQSVGAPLSRPNADGTGKDVVVPVRISVADQDALADLALASVTVGFASTLRNDVLTVPVDALVPLDDTHYAVEVPHHGGSTKPRLIPVTVGAVTSGKVEISGKGIVEGLLVAVPAR